MGSASTPTIVAPPSPTVVLRLEGSGTIGVELAPALVEAFERQRGAPGVSRQAGSVPDMTTLIANATSGPEAIAIRSEGTAEGFRCLAAGACDVVMAAREINDAEEADLAAKGL